MNKTKLFVMFAAVLVLLFLTGSYRMYEIHGASDAPTLLLNDRVLVNKSTYDATLPFTFKKLWPRKQPQRGDLVLCTIPQNNKEITAVKRIIAVPGDRFEINSKKVILNGDTLSYELLSRNDFNDVPTRNQLGNIIAVESAGDVDHLVSWTLEDSSSIDFAPVTLKENEYFVLGDNRDRSWDSRHFGAITKEKIHGKVIHIFNTGSRVKGE